MVIILCIRGTDGEALPGVPRLQLTYVGCPERAPPPENPFPHDIPWTTAMLNMVTGSPNPHGSFYG